MTLQIAFSKSPRKQTDSAVVFVYDGKKLGTGAKALDKSCGGFIAHSLKKAPGFTGQPGEIMILPLPAKAPYETAILAGMGKEKDLTALKAEEAGGKIFPALDKSGARHACLMAEDAGATAHFCAGLKLRSYKFTKYKSKKKDAAKKEFSSLDVTGAAQASAAKIYKPLSQMIEGVFWARDLVNEPPNTLYPDAFAKAIAKELKPLGVAVEIFDEKKMLKLGMHAHLAVGMGSDFPPRVVIMRWQGGKAKAAPLALVGKGVTFDTGGISIKPAAGMEEMKLDMGGAAAVVGTMKVLALRGSKSNVVGIVGLAENMPSGRAYRPSDIIGSHAGKTIEVQNTDAEGRLVLADALSYVQKTFKPRAIIDLATLTGAMMVALGHEYCGTFVNDDKFWAALEKSSAQTGEKLWRMPLDEVWKKDMESPIADLQNLGRSGRYGGACTAAGFLEHFIEGKTPWAHMDVAGTAWIKADKPTVTKNGTGFGVRVLDRLIANDYES